MFGGMFFQEFFGLFNQTYVPETDTTFSASQTAQIFVNENALYTDYAYVGT